MQIKDYDPLAVAPQKTDKLILQQASDNETLYSTHENLMKIDNLDAGGALTGTEKVLIDGGVTTTTGAISGIGASPSGSIMMYGGAAAPTGWLLCNGSEVSQTTYAALFAVLGTTFNTGGEAGGNFRLPDFGGIFPRGAGTNHTLSDAGSTAFAGTLGTYQNDKMQGFVVYNGMARSTTSPFVYGNTTTDMPGSATAEVASAANARTYQGKTSGPKDDGVNGTPRAGTETNPANLGITFIIKT